MYGARERGMVKNIQRVGVEQDWGLDLKRIEELCNRMKIF